MTKEKRLEIGLFVMRLSIGIFFLALIIQKLLAKQEIFEGFYSVEISLLVSYPLLFIGAVLLGFFLAGLYKTFGSSVLSMLKI